MQILLMGIVVALFIAILFVSFYFRSRVLKAYGRLVRNRVQFEPTHLFNKKKLEEEILPRYPEHREDILTFVNNIRFSMKCASILIILITAFAAILMFIKE